MNAGTWILIGAAVVVVFVGDFIYNRITRKAGKMSEDWKNRQQLKKGASQDENLADRFKK